jgi:hypothetical protein
VYRIDAREKFSQQFANVRDKKEYSYCLYVIYIKLELFQINDKQDTMLTSFTSNKISVIMVQVSILLLGLLGK